MRARHLSHTIVACLVLLLLPLVAAAESYRVIRVVDGDTAVIDYHGIDAKVRFLCVNTPESVHPDTKQNVPMGKVASKYTEKRLSGKQIDLGHGDEPRDKYGRLLAYIFVDGVNFNVELVRQGLSPYYTKYGTCEPYAQQFREAEQLAQREKLNIWGDAALTQEYTGKKAEWAHHAANSAAKMVVAPGEYIGNSKSMKFHKPSCRWAVKISDKNKVVFKSREEAIRQGYKSCGVCNP